MKPKFIAFLAVMAVLLPASLSNWGLTESSEARYAQISKEMFVSGNLIHPKLLGINHYHKPPATYYITAFGYFIFGVNEFGARFFLQIALLLQLLLVFKITYLLYNDKDLSLAAMLIFFSYPIVQIAAKNLTTDAYLTTLIFSSIYFFLKYHRTERSTKDLYLFYIFCGLSFFTKGPVGVLPQLIFSICYLTTFKIKVSFRNKQLSAIILCMLICFWWFGVLLYQNEKFLNYFIKYQIVDRVSSDAFTRTKPIWYYLITMPMLALPAVFYLFDYLRINIRILNIGRTISSIMIITLLISFFAFSLSSSKLILYVLPLYLFTAVLSAKHLSTVPIRTQAFFENISLGFALVVFSGLFVMCFVSSPFEFPIQPIFVLGGVGILGATICKYSIFKVSYLKAPFINALSISLLMFIMPFLMKANELNINSVKPISQFILSKAGHESIGNIVVFNYLLPSISFYTNQKIITVDNGNASAKRETQFETDTVELRKNYIRLESRSDVNALSFLLSKPNSFLIEHNKKLLPDSLLFLKKGFQNKTTLKQWNVYY